MARALSRSPLFSFLFSDVAVILARRRGYSVATEAVRRNLVVEEKSGISSFIGSKLVNRSDSNANSAGSWTPDPITGYYRPANRDMDLDAAELREMFLRPRV